MPRLTGTRSGKMTEPAYKERIDAWVDAHTEEMIEDLKQLVRIPSMKGEALEDMPYGREPARALEAMSGLMERYGLKVTNYRNYCVTGDLPGQGEKALDILAHLDVVPVSDTWTKTQPFEPKVEGDRIYGRGTSDDKGPAIAALYAMRAVRELGFDLREGVRLICGSDEECGSSDLEYYYQFEKEARYTFSPDADYPLINIEKGHLSKTFCKKGAIGAAKEGKIRVISLQGGDKSNVVPGRASMVLAGTSADALARAAGETADETGAAFSCTDQEDGTVLVLVSGRTGHAASPENGINSLTASLAFLGRLDLADREAERSLMAVSKLWPFGDHHGEALGVPYEDEQSGALTMTLDILSFSAPAGDPAYTIEGCYDSRAPMCADDRNLTDKIRARLAEEGFEMEEGGMVPAHCVSADSELVRRLLESYELYFGKKGEPVAIGGGTYVHHLERGVAFGCAVPEVDNRMHGDDEFMEIPMLVKSAKIFADAILRLCS